MIRSRIRSRGCNIPWYLSDAYKADGVSPSLIADFANNRYAANSVAKNFSDVFTFTRASTATYFDSAGIMRTAAIDTPRLDHDPATGEALGLLTEGQRTNYIKNSELFNNWTVNTGATVSVNTDTAPDGELTMDTVNMAASLYSGVFRFDLAAAVSTSYCFSMFVKHKSGGKKIKFGSDGSGTFGTSTAALATFDTETLTFSSVGSAVTSYGYIDVGGGIYRIYVVATSTASASGNVTTPIFNGDGTIAASFAVWGYQLEIGSFPSSYIPTSGSAVTRSADVVTNSASNTVKFADWYNQSEGTVLAKAKGIGGDAIYPRVYEISDGTSGNRHNIHLVPTTRGISLAIFNGGVLQASRDSGISGLAAATAALAYKINNFAFSVNGDAPTTDTSGTPPTVTKLNIGSHHSNGETFFGTIKELRYYPIRVTDLEMVRITT